MTVDMSVNNVAYNEILSFMREQSTIMLCQKRLIESQQIIIESQRLHLETQDKRIQQLIKEGELIKTSSSEMAKIIVNTEINAHLKRTETNTTEMTKKIRALKVESDAMKAVAMSTSIVVAGCISYPLIPVVVVGCVLLANVN